ncbi:hypothetical protein MMC25_000156 [Agyrium rufum]|nr:hypothetical protein [Agyrium rufum]
MPEPVQVAIWNDIYKKELPRLALAKSPTQMKGWPVHLDHCFARIIMDNVVGGDVPWTEVVKSPAVKHMSTEQMAGCIEMGLNIAEGRLDLAELNARSLRMRDALKRKRKRTELETADLDPTGPAMKSAAVAKPKREGTDIRKLFDHEVSLQEKKDQETVPTSAMNEKTISSVQMLDPELPDDPLLTTRRLVINSSLTPIRKSLYLALLEVPKGNFTTYAAIASHLNTSARAVGSAMRNNPWAPEVPCHRVLASGGNIGGFGGDWGDGIKIEKKRKLLRAEGVRFDGKGRAVGTPFAAWR